MDRNHVASKNLTEKTNNLSLRRKSSGKIISSLDNKQSEYKPPTTTTFEQNEEIQLENLKPNQKSKRATRLSMNSDCVSVLIADQNNHFLDTSSHEHNYSQNLSRKGSDLRTNSSLRCFDSRRNTIDRSSNNFTKSKKYFLALVWTNNGLNRIYRVIQLWISTLNIKKSSILIFFKSNVPFYREFKRKLYQHKSFFILLRCGRLLLQ